MMNNDRRLKSVMLFLAACSITFAMGCHTSTQVMTPEKTLLYINDRPIVLGPTGGKVVTRPFFWSASGGIPYRLVRDGVMTQSGTLTSSFRIASIFWPPYAFIYWPIGFGSPLYDLNNDPLAQKYTPAQTSAPAPPAQ